MSAPVSRRCPLPLSTQTAPCKAIVGRLKPNHIFILPDESNVSPLPDKDFVVFEQFCQNNSIESVLGIEIVYQNKAYGVLVLHQLSHQRHWQAIEIAQIENIAQ
jgi:GAF domain-containing protein